MHTNPPSAPPKLALPPLVWLLLAGFDFGLAGYASAWLLLRDAAEDWQALTFAAPAAAFLLGVALWRLLVLHYTGRLWLRGAIAGGLTGLLAHPLAWYLASLYFFFSGASSSLGEPALNPLEAIPASLLYALLSLLAAGWITVPLGALVGLALAGFQKALYTRRGGNG